MRPGEPLRRPVGDAEEDDDAVHILGRAGSYTRYSRRRSRRRARNGPGPWLRAGRPALPSSSLPPPGRCTSSRSGGYRSR
jgi:hypothetical protein